MKKMQIAVLTVALVLCGAAFAQHGHGMGGPSMANGMGEGGSHRMGPSTSMQGSSTHGLAMDQLLTKNTALAGKISDLTKMPATQACSNFKNLGQCVAAAHVSKNLGITFACMKADITGVAAPSTDGCPVSPNLASGKGMSLGKAIQTLQPTANSKQEAKKGQKQADQDIKQTSAS